MSDRGLPRPPYIKDAHIGEFWTVNNFERSIVGKGAMTKLYLLGVSPTIPRPRCELFAFHSNWSGSTRVEEKRIPVHRSSSTSNASKNCLGTEESSIADSVLSNGGRRRLVDETDSRVNQCASVNGRLSPETTLGIGNNRRTERTWALVENLYSRHANNLRGYIRKLVGSGPPDPDDVVHAAFEKLSTVDDLNEIKSPHGFLWRTAQNIVISTYRSAAVRERHQQSVTDIFYPEQSDDADPERILLARRELSIVMRAIDSMSPSRRQVLLMNRVEGKSLLEIADRLGISRSAAHKRLTAAMTELHAAAEKE